MNADGRVPGDRRSERTEGGPARAAPLLDVAGLEASYGLSQVLHGITFAVREGEVATLIGRNGMGKSTTIRCVIGLMRPHAGTISFAGTAVAGLPAYRVARAGIALVPEGRQIFPNLTVYENLVATAQNRSGRADPWTLERVYGLFPRLRERQRNLGSNLSGGEQQMLAIGRALMTNPRLLILDEATEGLAPLVRAEIWKCLGDLKAMGQALVVVDKNIGPLLKLADRHFVVEKGRIVWSGTSAELTARPELLRQYVGV